MWRGSHGSREVVPSFSRPSRGETVVLRSDTLLTHIYFAGGDHPGAWNGFRHFGPTSARSTTTDCHRETIPTAVILYAVSDSPRRAPRSSRTAGS